MLGISTVLNLIPEGNVGLAIKVGLSVLGLAWWTSAPGADEASDFKAKTEKRRNYGRHFVLKGRARKEHFRQSVKDDRSEMVPTKASCLKD